MARLRNRTTGAISLLEPEHLVGRSPRCSLCLDATYVSGQHATLRFTGDGWELRDLGSRNGTFLDGVRLPAGEVRRLAPGAVIGFGQASDAWEVEDLGAPAARVVPAGGDPVWLEADLLALPSPDDPRATILRDGNGCWQLERVDQPNITLTDGSRFELEGITWQFFCPAVVQPTSALGSPRVIKDLGLEFLVSRDEEHVELQALHGGARHHLGDRARNYLLLQLARCRLDDHEAGRPSPSCGWVDQEQLLDDLRIPSTQLNVDIYRIRRQFASPPLELQDSAQIIERRREKQLRLGVERVTIRVV